MAVFEAGGGASSNVEDEAQGGAKPKRVSVYENQRKNLMGAKGFGAENLYGYERSAWSDEEGLPSGKDDPQLVAEGWAFAPSSRPLRSGDSTT